MVIAMVAGMVILGGVFAGALALAGTSSGTVRSDAPVLALLIMAFNMTLPMCAWMRYRGHSWYLVREMAAAMIVPTLAVIAIYEAGSLGKDSLLAVQHIAMLPVMLIVMLLRRTEYSSYQAKGPSDRT